MLTATVAGASTVAVHPTSSLGLGAVGGGISSAVVFRRALVGSGARRVYGLDQSRDALGREPRDTTSHADSLDLAVLRPTPDGTRRDFEDPRDLLNGQ